MDSMIFSGGAYKYSVSRSMKYVSVLGSSTIKIKIIHIYHYALFP